MGLVISKVLNRSQLGPWDAALLLGAPPWQKRLQLLTCTLPFSHSQDSRVPSYPLCTFRVPVSPRHPPSFPVPPHRAGLNGATLPGMSCDCDSQLSLEAGSHVAQAVFKLTV